MEENSSQLIKTSIPNPEYVSNTKFLSVQPDPELFSSLVVFWLRLLILYKMYLSIGFFFFPEKAAISFFFPDLSLFLVFFFFKESMREEILPVSHFQAIFFLLYYPYALILSEFFRTLTIRFLKPKSRSWSQKCIRKPSFLFTYYCILGPSSSA